MKNILSVLALCVILSGCMATGAVYKPQPVGSNTAQVVIYRPSAFGLHGLKAEIEVNGKDACDLPMDGYTTVNVPPGEAVIAADTWQLPGTSKLVFNAKAGSRYYIRVSVNGGKETLRALGGVIASQTLGGQGGPFSVTEGSASEVSSMKGACK